MTKLLTALAIAASLGGCVTHDYCAESHPVALRQLKPEWEANYRTCRMMEAVTMSRSRPSIDVYLH
jgi:hypothetical protein